MFSFQKNAQEISGMPSYDTFYQYIIETRFVSIRKTYLLYHKCFSTFGENVNL